MTTIATECPRCPKGIVSCAHLGDRVVWLVDTRVLQLHDIGVRPIEIWSVAGPSPARQCPCPIKHIVLFIEDQPTDRTDSLPEAEAEYERRCALLRAGP